MGKRNVRALTRHEVVTMLMIDLATASSQCHRLVVALPARGTSTGVPDRDANLSIVASGTFAVPHCAQLRKDAREHV